MTNTLQFGANSMDIIDPFTRRIASDGDVQVIGGVSISAMAHPDAYFDSHQREITVPDDFSLSSRRPDGSLRDVDILVNSTNPTRIHQVETDLRETIGDQLEHSVFSILPNQLLERQRARPFGLMALRVLLSNRYEDPTGTETYVKSLFPFSATIDPESMETWTLAVGNDLRIPVPHPGTTLLNYMTRSVSGVRPRDKEKLAAAAINTFNHSPEIHDWLVNGPGKSQFELAKVLASLNTPAEKKIPLIDGIDISTYSHRQIAEHETFMVPELTPSERQLAIGIASIKAYAVTRLESSPQMISLFHHFLERHASIFTKNT
jgi:hypothetical protein